MNAPRPSPSPLLLGLFVLAALYTLYFARDFLLPVTLALLFSFLLSPLVRALGRLRVPSSVGAGVLLLAVLGIAGLGFSLLAEPASEWVDKAPTSLRRVERKLRQLQRPVAQVSEAAQQVEKLADQVGKKPAGGVQQVEIRKPSLSDTLLSGTGRMLATAAVVMVLLYFLLASGEAFLGKLLRLLPDTRSRHRAAHLAGQIERQVSTYLLTITTINLCLGAAVGTVMYFMEMPNPILWGALAAALNFIPYLGALVGVVILTAVALLTFDNVGWALATGGLYLSLTALEGGVITPILLGHRLTLNPVVVFLSLMFWGWLWGIPGALMAVPLTAAFKIFCDQVRALKPVGELLGR